MSFIPQFNPQVVSPGRIRRFNGVFGKQNEVIQKADSSGRDLSDGFCNDQQDLNSDEKGSMRLREGFTRLGSGSDATIHSIFEVRLGGNIQYGAVDGTLTLYDIPWLTYPKLPLPPKRPEEPPLPTDFPASFQSPDEEIPPPVAPLSDPSVPPAEAPCEISHEHNTSPTSLTFNYVKGSTLPDAQYWYWEVFGWWDKTHYGIYNERPSWLDAWESACWTGRKAPCKNYLQKAVKCKITSAAADLAVGAHTFNHNLVFTDGGSHGCAITLNVIECIMGVVTPITLSLDEAGSFTTQDPLVISNSTSGTTLNWTASITFDTSGKLQLASSSGSIAGPDYSNVVLSFSSTPSPGTYIATIRVSGNGSPAYIDATVNITVLALSGTRLVITRTGDPWPVEVITSGIFHGPVGSDGSGWAVGGFVTGPENQWIEYYTSRPSKIPPAYWFGTGWYCNLWSDPETYSDIKKASGVTTGNAVFPWAKKVGSIYPTTTFSWVKA